MLDVGFGMRNDGKSTKPRVAAIGKVSLNIEHLVWCTGGAPFASVTSGQSGAAGSDRAARHRSRVIGKVTRWDVQGCTAKSVDQEAVSMWCTGL